VLLDEFTVGSDFNAPFFPFFFDDGLAVSFAVFVILPFTPTISPTAALFLWSFAPLLKEIYVGDLLISSIAHTRC